MRDHLSLVRFVLLLPALLLVACASQIPHAIRDAPAENPTPDAVRDDPAGSRDRQVRWGGEILATENRENDTRLTVLARPLSRGGEPEETDDSQGRFIAIVPGFLDPKVYGDTRRITVTGTVLRNETGKVGDYVYTFPLIQVQEYYLWPKVVAPPRGYYPGWDNPWYDPWYNDRWYPMGYPYYRY